MLYATFVVILVYIMFTLYPSTVDIGCPFFHLLMNSLAWYITFVEIMQMRIIHLLLLYKHVEIRTTQRLQTLCCNIRSRLWNDVMIVCIQLGLPLPVLIVDIVVILKTRSVEFMYEVGYDYIKKPLLAVNILLGLICTVLLVSWCCMLWKRRLLKNKVKFVCTEMGHIIITRFSCNINREHTFDAIK